MASPEGTFEVAVDAEDMLTRRYSLALDASIRMLLLAHDYPASLQMEVLGTDDVHRQYSNGGLLAHKGITPELSLELEDDVYFFSASLEDPSRTTTTRIVNRVDANHMSDTGTQLLKVQRTFIPQRDRNGVCQTRKPGSHELRATAAIASVASATDRLSREFEAVSWVRH